MPRTKKQVDPNHFDRNFYEVEHYKFKNYPEATAYATNLSIERGEAVTITEYSREGKLYISISASTEEA